MLGLLTVTMAAFTIVAQSTEAGRLQDQSWGVYAAPTGYQFVSGPLFDLSAGGTSLEGGLFYRRFLAHGFAARVEARYATRRLDATVSDPAPGRLVRVSEEFVEIPVMLQSEDRTDIAGRALRISLGAGVCYGVLVKQELTEPPGSSYTGPPAPELSFGDYHRIAWLIDGGVSLEFDPGRAVFAHFRLQRDMDTFAEADNVTMARLYAAYGIYGGLEFGF